MDNIHYVKEQDNLVPAGMTEFARDKTFGYKSSDLTEYVEEKTEGKYHKEDCITISLDELNALDVQGIKEKLMSAQNMAENYSQCSILCRFESFLRSTGACNERRKALHGKNSSCFHQSNGKDF